MSNQSLMSLVTELVARIEEGSLEPGFHRAIHRGSAHGSVAVEPDPGDPSQLMIIVRMAIRTVPTDGVRAFFATLLELNHGFHGRAAFSLDDLGVVNLTAGRHIANLDENEVVDLILWTSEQADYWDDVLLEEFD